MLEVLWERDSVPDDPSLHDGDDVVEQLLEPIVCIVGAPDKLDVVDLQVSETCAQLCPAYSAAETAVSETELVKSEVESAGGRRD
jgi:hypothetical protein